MTLKTPTIKPTDWQHDKDALRAIRQSVFVDEQAVPVELEWDQYDESASHWLALIDDQAIATARLLNDGHIGRMAVLKNHRGCGIGRQLLQAIIEECRQRQLLSCYLYAQTHAVGFYKTMGFDIVGDEFMDAGIPHLKMIKPVTEQRLLGVHGGRYTVKNLADTVLDLISQCERQLLIFSYDLDKNLYDHRELIDAVSQLARKSRYTQVKLLVVDSKSIVKRGHGLLNLARRLSSKIEIRKTTADLKDLPEAFIIADQRGLLAYDLKNLEGRSAWANYNNKPAAQALAAEFDLLWQHASHDRELQLLGIS